LHSADAPGSAGTDLFDRNCRRFRPPQEIAAKQWTPPRFLAENTGGLSADFNRLLRLPVSKIPCSLLQGIFDRKEF